MYTLAHQQKFDIAVDDDEYGSSVDVRPLLDGKEFFLLSVLICQFGFLRSDRSDVPRADEVTF